MMGAMLQAEHHDRRQLSYLMAPEPLAMQTLLLRSLSSRLREGVRLTV